MQPKKCLRSSAGNGVKLDEIPVLRKFSKHLLGFVYREIWIAVTIIRALYVAERGGS